MVSTGAHTRARVVALAAIASAACDDGLILITGTTCDAPADCMIHPSCSRRIDGCVCKEGACYLDPEAPLVDPSASDTRDCRTCHGSLRNSAPPRALDGTGHAGQVGVGAHQAHLSGGRQSRRVGCRECHLVPSGTNDAGHIDDPWPAEVTWGGLAANDGAQPRWDRATGTCSNVYCHGVTLAGPTPDLIAAPDWNAAGGTQARCGTCHGMPPLAPHPANDKCEICHLPVSGPNQTIATPTFHVDGVVQVSLADCTGCHGNQNNLAPAQDCAGNSDTALVTVGAHQAHVAGGSLSRAVPCDTCHVVPTSLTDTGHQDTIVPRDPADVTFHLLAIAGGAQPTWDRTTGTCSASYCHGGTMTGGTLTQPVWTIADGTQAACGTCHGLPPPHPHPQAGACMLCHVPTAGPGFFIADRTTHIDGILQASDGGCDDCHGSAGSAAPPADTNGEVDTTLMSVGAHRSHVEARNLLAAPVPCSECHLVPLNTDDPGHVDTPLPAEVSWGALATWDGASPSFDASVGTCAGSYCHGATLRDGTLTAPLWTGVDGTQIACGTCHGMPPAGAHPADDRCELCHLPTAGPSHTVADRTTHVDGVLQAAGACDTCHGQNGEPAPPPDSTGLTDTAEQTVGAHQTHRTGGAASRPVECSQCHVVPVDRDDPGHIDTARPAELVFGGIATIGATPSWTPPTCQSTYCHDGVDATDPSPTWTVVGGSQTQCGGCHGMPPNTVDHQGRQACNVCHLPTAGATDTEVADRSTHVDGVVQAAVDCDQCHGDSTSSAPPIDLGGDTDPSDPQVGAHRVHLSGGTSAAAVPCDTCHVVPPDKDFPGHLDAALPAEVTWSGRASLLGAVPIWNPADRTCAGTYCHAAASSLGTNPIPTWNQPGSVPCDGCHGMPPAPPHPQWSACELCHAPVAGPSQTIRVTDRHVDGIDDVDTMVPCESCHGSAASPAPPTDLAGNSTSAQVGAHTVHLNGSGDSRPVPCSECHVAVSPSTPDQAGHYDTLLPAEVTFGLLARQGGLTPAWDGTTCSGSYCHGATMAGGGPDPGWSGAALGCDGCHGMPPTDANHPPGPTIGQCEICHPDVAGPSQTIVNAQRHVDGVVDTSASCDACHGGGGDPTPPVDLAGNLSGPKVGTHAEHRTPQNSAPTPCVTCHQVPLAYGDAGHADTPAPAEVVFGSIAATGTNPSFDAGQLRCSDTYCHGATLAGGKTEVGWDDTSGNESQCGACHGMPPSTAGHSGVSTNDSCDVCHDTVAGPGFGNIINPALHVDGQLQVSGGGCSSCHPSPPTPADEDYPGGGGAHAAHDGLPGVDCSTCHGNNGSGPTHDEGGLPIQASRVQVTFAALTFPGGTTMDQLPATYDRAQQQCRVGCHNPIVGNPAESANDSNRPRWLDPPVACLGCHDAIESSLPRNHDVPADADCLQCHASTGHTTGLIAMADPDTGDSFAYSPGNFNGLCKTCHDGSGGNAFGGSAQDVSPFWKISSHGAAGYACDACHTYHASAGGPLMVDPASSNCLASGCHNNLVATFNLNPGGVRSHHRLEGGTNPQGDTILLACIDCHNPHLAQQHPLAASDPDDAWSLVSLPDAARTQRTTAYNGFCLACHDNNEPPAVSGALNIAAALSGGTDPSEFVENGNHSRSWHRNAHDRYSCMNCHHWHGSSGSFGIQRGRMLLNYMDITSTTYTRKRDCGTSGRPSSFGCH